jgi:hypothetical protein
VVSDLSIITTALGTELGKTWLWLQSLLWQQPEALQRGREG